MSRESAMAYISALEQSDLAQFFYEAFQQRRQVKSLEEHGIEVTAICIASFYQVVQGHKASDPVIHVLAPAINPDNISPMDMDQTGYCRRCNLQIACATKIAICPVCDSKILCT